MIGLGFYLSKAGGGRLKLDEWITNGWMIGLDFYLSNLSSRLGMAGSSWMNEAQTVGCLVWIFTYQTCVAGLGWQA